MEISDFLIIGSGISGLFSALNLSKKGKVTILTKKSVWDSSSFLAQGGIAAVVDTKDSIENHIKDTISAGAGLCHPDIVKIIVERGPWVIKKIEEIGVKFARNREGNLDLGKEGGHSKRRIAHIGDFTGMHLIKALYNEVIKNPDIRVVENHTAIDLIVPSKFGADESKCVGCYALDNKSGKVKSFIAPCTILATGGAGKVYLYTSNPDIACGDGIAMAFRAGVPVANMEFFQFHPTCLYHPLAKGFLISEALRGEGGILKRCDGTSFMKDYHPDGDLAPRDIVARAIDDQMKKSGDDYVLLDISHLDSDFIKKRFPNIYEKCFSFGIDITSVPIPVVPAAHYTCGGVVTDEWGRTILPGLWCIGESACTGLHGANRLASNSLLEGIVMADRASQSAIKLYKDIRVDERKILPWNPGTAVRSQEQVVVSQDWDEIRRFMWNYVGIVRSNNRLLRARRRLNIIREEIEEYYWNYFVTSDLIELRNIALVADMIIESAMFRKESRGLHYNIDYPEHDDLNWLGDTILKIGQKPYLEKLSKTDKDDTEKKHG